MRLEAKKYLYDMQRAAAAALIADFTSDNSLDDYTKNPMLRSAVERQFEIIGEALAGLAKLDQALAARLTDYRRIISFRNILIHGYADVDDRLVWDIVETKLPLVRQEIDTILAET